MYNKYIVSLIILCGSLTLFSQEFAYDFTLLTGQNYVPLTDADTVDTNGPWDDPTVSVPIGFDVTLFGTETTNMVHFNNLLGGVIMGSTMESPAIAPYNSDLIDRGRGTGQSQSHILYKVDGESPFRIFKMEWQNAGFYNEIVVFGENESFVNFQVWLYETGLIEICYGPSNIVAENQVHRPGFNGPFVGLAESLSPTGSIIAPFWYLSGDPENPNEIDFVPVGIPDAALDDTPEIGTIYVFRPRDISSVNEGELATGMQLYPNPVTDVLQLKLDLEEVPDELEVRLFNTLGQEVHYQPLGQTTQSVIPIDMQQLPSGSYTVQLRDGKAQYSKMIIKS